jgi:iron complex transport system substrate-binding protein
MISTGWVRQTILYFASVAALMSAFAAGPARAAVEIVDDLGRRIVLESPAKRIIPLYGAFSEMLYVMGAGGQIIARTQADGFPPEIKRLPSVGTHMRPNVEVILGLKPDLVIQSATRREETPDLSKLVESGIPVAIFAPKSFEDIFAAIGRLGVIAGREAEARDSVGGMRERLERVKARLGNVEARRRVFFEIRAEPLTAAGRGSIVQEILEAAGAENVVKSEKAIVRYSVESLLVDDPDVYAVQRGPMNRNPADPAGRAHFGRLKSIREGRIVFVDELLFSRPGPRCIEAAEQLAEAVYPEKFH